MILCLVGLCMIFSTTVVGQSQPTSTNPPHNCPNYGLCAPFVNYNVTTLNCNASSCVCQPGTTGPNCALIDKCTPDPCNMTNFVCVNGVNNYTCQCAQGWAGPNCQYTTNSPCLNNPCYNGGTCNSTGLLKYTCTCPSGYAGSNCQYTNPCNSNPCGTNGVCYPIYDNQTYYCACNFDYMGRNCDSRVTQWGTSLQTLLQTSSCTAYSSILEDSTLYHKFNNTKMTISLCDNILRTYTADNVIYTTFVVMENYCYLSTKNYLTGTSSTLKANGTGTCYKQCPGGNNQVCGTINTTVIVSTDNPTGSYSNDCTKAQKSACLNVTGNGMCIPTPPSLLLFGGYMCICKPPAQPNGNSSSASTPCTSSKCTNGGTCLPNQNWSNYTCICPYQYSGNLCQFSNPCTSSSCKNGGTCINNLNGTYSCACLTWYHGNQCQNISACEYSNPCVNGTCINKGTGIQVYPYCQCQAGYTGLACDEEINFCTTYTPCDYNSTCIPSFNNYSCDCIPGTTDYNCSTIINNCVPYTDPSGAKYKTRCNTKDPHAQCINAINNFSCNCSSQWVGQYCDMNKIVEQVMVQIFGGVNAEYLPLLTNLLNSPAAINDMVPFLLGTMSSAQRTNLSWTYSDMFYWATYEEKELNIERDFVMWNDVVLGNCFTFNHYNATRFYKIRSSMSPGGLRVRMKINQNEYEPWTETAAMMVFVHNKLDYVFSESIRYNAEPNSEALLFPYMTEYTRLGGKYGACVSDPSEVKSYYYPGQYNSDGCYRSCYQDLIQKCCGCMDPRYPMPSTATSLTCIDDAVNEYGDPSTWAFCVCPVPCDNQDFGITWSKTTNCLDTSGQYPNGACQNTTADSVTIGILQPELTYSLFQETPTMDFNKFIGALGGLLGVLMGLGAIFFVEIGVMIFQVIGIITCFSADKGIKERKPNDTKSENNDTNEKAKQ